MAVFSLVRRASIAGLIASAALFYALPASAAGSLTITQKSPVGTFGDWTITQPNSGQVTIRSGEIKTFPLAEAGVYVLMVTPPESAKLTAVVTTDGTQTLSTTLHNFSFEVAEGQSVDVTLSYRYDGTIVVDSEPQGVSFELLASNSVRLTGITPATFTGLAPLTYRVTFQQLPDCYILPMQQRTLQANQTLSFFGHFTCGQQNPVVEEPAVVTEVPSETMPNERTLQIWATVQQSEVLPGDTARVTITVKNTGDRTVHDVSVSAQFDATLLSASIPMPRFGKVENDVLSWDIPELYAGKFWTVTVPLTANDVLQSGHKTSVTARVSASDITGGDDTQHVATVNIGIMTALPETGVRFDILFLAAAILFTLSIACFQKRQMIKVRA